MLPLWVWCGRCSVQCSKPFAGTAMLEEILSDYGFGGAKWCPQSSFGGLFPENLSSIFPWKEFFLSTQRDYLHKEEHVAGAHGVEARYPFLDPRVVQEYLWLAPEAQQNKLGFLSFFVFVIFGCSSSKSP